MQEINFNFSLDSANITKKEYHALKLSLNEELKTLKTNLSTKYESDYASINAPKDTKNLLTIKNLIEKKQLLNIKSLIVVGIGGSNLGTIAVHEAINGPFYNEKNPQTKIYFADTVDSDYLNEILQITENNLKNNENVLINVVTKSGTTTETIANYEIFLEQLKKFKPDNYQDYIVVTTDKNSKLYNYAGKNNIDCLEVPQKIGGRFSVFSAVGLFPLGFIGIDIDALLEGAKVSIQKCTSDNSEIDNPAIASAALIYHNYVNNKHTIHNSFFFYKHLNMQGAWYRQLVGESIGKKQDKNNKVVEIGITPTTSIGTTDHHSVAQLYLGGPRNTFTTFITVTPKNNISIPNMQEFDSLVANIQGKSLPFVMDAVVTGTMTAFKNDNRPFISVNLPEISAFTLGQLMQWRMCETIYLGSLLNINPFNQPQVELYKIETRKALEQ